MNQLLTTFLAATYSLPQARSRLVTLKNYLLGQFFNYKMDSNHPLGPEEMAWLNQLGNDFYKNFNKINMYQVLASLEKEIKKIQPVIIYLPFEMPLSDRKQLGIWLRANISPTTIFDLKFDPNLIAGCALSNRGTYKDYSLRDKIDKRRAEVISSMKGFLK